MEKPKVLNIKVKQEKTVTKHRAAARLRMIHTKVEENPKAKDPKGKDQKVKGLKKPKKEKGEKVLTQEADGDSGPRGPSGDLETSRILKRMMLPMYRIPVPVLGPVLTPMGTVCVILRYNVRVHVSPAGWVLMVNGNVGGMAGVSTQGNRSGMQHPSGSVHQSDAVIHVVTADGKRASLSPKGITFSSRANDGYNVDSQKRNGQLAYVLDDGGPRTTVASFTAFKEDFVVKLIAVGNTTIQWKSCTTLLHESYQVNAQHNTDTWVVGGIKVVQEKLGDCFAIWDNHCHLKASPDKGTLGISTSSVYATASVPPEPHVFVRNYSCRVHHDGQVLMVRNGSHVASLDAYGDFSLH